MARRYEKPDTCDPLREAAERGAVELCTLARGGYPGRRLAAGEARGLKSAGYWNAATDQEWGLDWHCNEGIEVGWLESGRLRFETEESRSFLRPGDLTITRPWQRHRVGDPDVSASRYHWFIVDVDARAPNRAWRWPSWILLSKTDRDLLARIIRLNEQPVWRATKAISTGFRSLANAAGCGDTKRAAPRAQVAINEILLALSDLFRREQPPVDESLSSSEHTVRLFLENLKHRCEEPWTLGTMAAECNLGRTQFAAHCRQLTNRPPLEYLAQCRISRARELLTARRDLSVTDIAFRCGFSSSQYFATAFRKITGVAPGTLRAERQSRN